MSKRKPRVTAHELTRQLFGGDIDDHASDTRQQFSRRSKFGQQNKTSRTSQMRLDKSALDLDRSSLSTGRVKQVHSVYCAVELSEGGRLVNAIVKKTLQRISDTRVVVGDIVRVRLVPDSSPGVPEAVVEAVEDRTTLLTRADSFKAMDCHPIVANAQQVLIVAAVAQPRPKWGLIDRMLVAASLGGLEPIVCINKLDLDDAELPQETDDEAEYPAWRSAIAHYASMGIRTLATCCETGRGIDDLRAALTGKITVLAGHSGVGKSSLVRSVAPRIDLRIGEVSVVNDKGKHTTTSARDYDLPELSARLIDTPGVKLFGLWGISPDKLDVLFADVASDTAPTWRVMSHQRIRDSL